mgnify:FL=1
MPIIKIFLEKPRILILFLVFVVLVGVSSFNTLPRQEMPELAQRWATVIQTYPGASAETLETQVVEVLEIRLREIPEVRRLESNINQGFATTLVELKDEVSFDLVEQIWSEVQDKIELAEQDIPPEATLKLNRSTGPPITVMYALQWTGEGIPPVILLSRIAEQLKQEFAYMGSTEEVLVHGSAQEEIAVLVDSQKLSALGISLQQLAKTISNFNQKNSVGMLQNSNEEILLRVKDNLTTTYDIEKLPLISKDNLQIISVGDVAQVKKQPAEPIESITLVNGNTAVLVEAKGSFNQRLDLYAEQTEIIVEKFEKTLPEEFSIDLVYDESFYIKERFQQLTRSIGSAAILVLLLSYFLLGLRSAILVSAILPLTISIVLFVCRLIELPLHQTSIVGMIIALGLLIDNAIIVVEDYRYRKLDGLSSNDAIFASVKHLFLPLLAATATTAFAFMPIIVGEGPSNEYIGGMAMTLIAAISTSLALSLLVILPMLFYLEKLPYLHRTRFANGYSNSTLEKKYRGLLLWSLVRPRRAILISLVLPLVGFLLFSTLKQDFFPANDRNMFQVKIELPRNTSAQTTLITAENLREQLAKYNFIKEDIWFVGRRLPRILGNVVGGDSELGSNNIAQGVYFTTNYWTMIKNIDEIAKDLIKNNPEIRIVVDSFQSGPPVFADIEYKVLGEDPEILLDLGNQLELILKKSPDVYLTKSQSNNYETNLLLNFENSNIIYSDQNSEFLVNQIFAANSGIVLGKLVDGDKEIPIRLQSINSSSSNIAQAPFLTFNNKANFGYIADYADISLARNIGSISRYKGKTENAVQAWTWPTSLPSQTETLIEAEINAFKEKLPVGYVIEQAGEAAESAESNAQLFSSAIVFFILIIVGLVFVLNSFRQTALITSVAGLCVGLAIMGLFVGMQNFGFIGIVGAIGLAGLAINDSIVVLAAMKADAKKTDYKLQELVETVIRATRHIITTTATTIGGLFPLIVSSVFFQPLAWAMSVGVIGASVIALFYIPAMFKIFSGIKN